tara:strand:- start:1339 stop:1542 length:204 start_codon:yes stop_codon:yes gene_type:complete
MNARHTFDVLGDAEGDDNRRRRRMARREVMKMESRRGTLRRVGGSVDIALAFLQRLHVIACLTRKFE